MDYTPDPVSKAIELMTETQRELVGLLPLTVPDETVAILLSTLLADSVGMHIGVQRCIAASVLAPALALCRTLVSSSTLLSYMEADAPAAEEIGLRFSWSELNREVELVRDQERVHGVDRSEILQGLENERAALLGEANALGIDITRNLPSIPDMAAAVEIDKPTFKHSLAILSQSVHTGRSSLRRRITPADDSLGAFTPRESDPIRLVEAGALANASLADGARSVSALQGWENASEVALFGNDVTVRFNTLQQGLEGTG